VENFFHGKKPIAPKQARKAIVCPMFILSGNNRRKNGEYPVINMGNDMIIILLACK
jgi:hypothetical protein